MDKIISPARLQLIKRAIQSQEKYLEELEQIRQQWRAILDQEAKAKGEPVKVSNLERKYLFGYGDLTTHS